jgi:hypothetical protein
MLCLWLLCLWRFKVGQVVMCMDVQSRALRLKQQSPHWPLGCVTPVRPHQTHIAVTVSETVVSMITDDNSCVTKQQ